MLKLTIFPTGREETTKIGPRHNEGVFTHYTEDGSIERRIFVADVVEGTTPDMVRQRAWIAQEDLPSREEPCL